MILTLKKAYNPGDADPGRTYTHLHIEQLTYNSSAYAVALSYAYGSLDENNFFVPGAVPGLQSLSAIGHDLDAMQSDAAKPNEPALAACLRLGYDFIQRKLSVEGDLDYRLPADPNAPTEQPDAGPESAPDSSAAPEDPSPATPEEPAAEG